MTEGRRDKNRRMLFLRKKTWPQEVAGEVFEVAEADERLKQNSVPVKPGGGTPAEILQTVIKVIFCCDLATVSPDLLRCLFHVSPAAGSC